MENPEIDIQKEKQDNIKNFESMREALEAKSKLASSQHKVIKGDNIVTPSANWEKIKKVTSISN